LKVLRLYDRLIDGLAYLAVVLLFAIMVAIGLDVAARYFLGQPIGWVFEFVQHSLLCILFFGMAWLTREGGHVAIELLLDALPFGIRRGMVVFAMATAGATSAFIAYWALLITIDNYRRGVETIGIYPIPRYWLLGVIALGLGLTAIAFFIRAVAALRGSEEAIVTREPSLEP
jgi:C4-dicarboxylate transporter, DctQ subunit